MWRHRDDMTKTEVCFFFFLETLKYQKLFLTASQKRNKKITWLPSLYFPEELYWCYQYKDHFTFSFLCLRISWCTDNHSKRVLRYEEQHLPWLMYNFPYAWFHSEGARHKYSICLAGRVILNTKFMTSQRTESSSTTQLYATNTSNPNPSQNYDFTMNSSAP